MSLRSIGLLLLAALIGVPFAQAQERPRNVILFISDGTGPATFTMGRDFARDQYGQEYLALDAIQKGSIRTYSSNSRVTDSAAGATAFASAVKTYNGAIGVDSLRRPVATVLEAAEAKGMATGLVATSRITHATPAAFSAHVPNRGMEAEIASQQIAQGIDVILGGGRGYYLPADRDGRRNDGRDLLAEAESMGYQVLLERDDLTADVQTPVLGLFAMDHLDFEVDRDTLAQPSIAEMTAAAIDLLDDDEDGFFLMVEGSRIDHAGHANDAAGHLYDLLAYDEAVAVALAYAEEHPETLVISTSDHETGGLSLGRNIDGRGVYAWHPEVLARVQTSHGPMIGAILTGELSVADVLQDYAGITDLTEEEVVLLEEATANGQALNFALAEVIARRAIIGWTTGGHTAVDVPLFAFGPGSEAMTGNVENTQVGQWIIELLGLELDPITAQLRQ